MRRAWESRLLGIMSSEAFGKGRRGPQQSRVPGAAVSWPGISPGRGSVGAVCHAHELFKGLGKPARSEHSGFDEWDGN